MKGKTKQPESYPFLTRLVDKTETERSKDPNKCLNGVERAWHSLHQYIFICSSLFFFLNLYFLLSRTMCRNIDYALNDIVDKT